MIHDSNTCQLGPDNGPCEMCAFANEHSPVVKTVVKDLGTPFEREWSNAPRSARNYVESSIAEYWFLRGRQVEREEMLAIQVEDLREMARVAQERIIR